MYWLSGESAASGESPPETDILTTHLHLQDLCMGSQRDSKGTEPVLKEFLAWMLWGAKQGSFAEQNGAAELGAGPKQGPQMVFPWKFPWRSCSLTGQQHVEVTSSTWNQAAFSGSQAWEQGEGEKEAPESWSVIGWFQCSAPTLWAGSRHREHKFRVSVCDWVLVQPYVLPSWFSSKVWKQSKTVQIKTRETGDLGGNVAQECACLACTASTGWCTHLPVIPALARQKQEDQNSRSPSVHSNFESSFKLAQRKGSEEGKKNEKLNCLCGGREARKMPVFDMPLVCLHSVCNLADPELCSFWISLWNRCQTWNTQNYIFWLEKLLLISSLYQMSIEGMTYLHYILLNHNSLLCSINRKCIVSIVTAWEGYLCLNESVKAL